MVRKCKAMVVEGQLALELVGEATGLRGEDGDVVRPPRRRELRVGGAEFSASTAASSLGN